MLAGSRIVTIRDLGKRLADMRIRLGKTQADLGADVDLTSGYISKIERGEVEGLPVGKLLAMADALDAHVMIVCNAEDDDVREQDSKLILPFRQSLLMPHANGPVDETELTHAKLRKRVLDTTADFNKARYVKLAVELPDLVAAIEAAIGLHAGETKENLYRLLAHVHILTAQTLILLRSEDLAFLAVKAAMETAENAGDLVLRAKAVQTHGWAFIRQGMYEAAETVAVNMANELEPPSMPRATPEHLAAWGGLFEIASGAAAHNNRPDAARELLNLAHSAAVRIDGDRIDYGKYWAALDATRIEITKVSNALIGGDAGLALHIGQTVRRTKNTHLDTWTRFLLDMADAQTSTRDYVKAIKTMRDIRELAPEWIKNHRVAHDVVIRLLGKVSSRRAKSSGLAELATFMGVQP